MKVTRARAGEDELGGPLVPPMQVVGFVEGYQLSALLRIGGRVELAVPGREIAYGGMSYRVDRLEPGKVVLVNRWERGEERGLQRIEATLSGSGLAPGAMP